MLYSAHFFKLLAVAAPAAAIFLAYYAKKMKNGGRLIELEMPSSYFKLEISVPLDKVYVVIGREGSIIRQIERDYTVKLKLDESPNRQADRILTIKGQREDVLLADVYIRKIIAQTPPTLQCNVLVPRISVGSIIGRGGFNVKEMCRSSGAKIYVNKTDSEKFETVEIKGSPQAIFKAQELINEKLKIDYEARQRWANAQPGESSNYVE